MHRRIHNQSVHVVEPDGDPISAVTGLVISELFRGNENLAYSHYRGLCGLIGHRGNRSKDISYARQQLLTAAQDARDFDNPALAQKIARTAQRYARQLPTPVYDDRGPYVLEEIVNEPTNGRHRGRR